MTLPRQARHDPATTRPLPDEARRLIGVLRQHPNWSVFWDKRHEVLYRGCRGPGRTHRRASCAHITAASRGPDSR